MSGITISIKEAAIILRCSYNTAQRSMKAIKDSLSKEGKKKKYVTIKEFSDEMQISLAEIAEALGR